MPDEKPDPQAEPEVTFTREETPESLDELFQRPEMQQIAPKRDELPASDVLIDKLEGRAPDPVAPAVHGDELWGGPRFIRDAESEPVYVATKQEYWDLLAKNGLRMRDQQESVVPSDVLPTPAPIEISHTPHPEVRPMTKHEAEVFGAVTAVFQHYGLVESLWCSSCFARNVPHGCRMKVDARGVALQCRGGIASWQTPIGERNMLLTTLANTTSSRAHDRAPGTVLTPAGPVFRPAAILLREEAMILREYFKALNARNIEPRWHHKGCWRGNPWCEDDALAIYVDDATIVAVCACRQLFSRTSSEGAAPPLVH